MSKIARLAAIGAAVAILAVVGLLVLGLSLNPNLFKDQFRQAIQSTAGLTVVFDGDIGIQYFPSLGVELNNVAIMAPDEMGGGELFRVGKMVVNVKLLPLLSKNVEAGMLTFDKLEVHLVRDEKGNLNIPRPPVKDVKVENDKIVITTDDNRIYAINYQIAGVKVTKASLVLDDRMAHSTINIANFNLSTGAVIRGKDFPVKLDFDYANKDPDAAGQVDISGKAMAIPELLQFSFVNATVKTSLSGKTLPFKTAATQYTGNIRIDLTRQTFQGENLKFAASAKGGLFPEAGAGFSMGMNAAVDMAAGTADLTGFTIDAMGFTATGEAHATAMNTAAKVSATFATNEFNPKEVLGKAGVTVNETGTAKAKAMILVDMAKASADITDVVVNALGMEVKSRIQARHITSEPVFTGTVAISDFNPRLTLARLGVSLPRMTDGSALTRARLDCAFESSGKKASLKTESFVLDSTALSLNASMEKARKPLINFTLKADSLDLDRYLPPSSAAPSPSQSSADKPMDIPLNATGTVEIGALKAAKLHLQNFSTHLTVKDNQVELNPVQLSLYQGWAKGAMKADLRSPTPPVGLNLAMDGVQMEPLLTDLLGRAPLAGRATLTAVVTAKGVESKQALASLAGKTGFALRNGALLGYSVSPDTLQSKEALMTKGKGGGARTTFESVSGSFIIERGVISGNDFQASVSPHRATGQGWANLVTGALDYYIFARFLQVAVIPLHATGTIYDPSISVEPSMLFKGTVEQGAKGVVDTLLKSPVDAGKGALDAVGNILGLPKKK